MAFGFDLAALSAYLNQEANVRDIYRNAMYGNDTAPWITTINGVKDTNALPTINHERDVLISAANKLTLANANGDIEVKQVNLPTAKLAYLNEFRLDELEGFFTQQYLPAGQNYGLGDAESVLATMLGNSQEFGIPAVINRQVEDLTWRGDTDLTGTPLALVNGFNKILAGVSPVSVGAITDTNAIARVEGLVNAAAEDGDWRAAITTPGQAHVYIGFDAWRKYCVNYRKEHGVLNYNNEFNKVMVDGTAMMMIPVSGLTGTDFIYLARPEAMVQGSDIIGDKDQINLGFSEIEETVWAKVKFRLGFACRDASDKSVLVHRPTVS